jgi:hypothetical protein
MGNATAWKPTGLTFIVPGEFGRLIQAEVGITGRYLSFVVVSPTGERRRAEITVTAETADGAQHRQASGKVIRGIDEAAAKQLIDRINKDLSRTGTILKETRRETTGNQILAVYKRRDRHSIPPPCGEQTPELFRHNPNTEITAVSTCQETMNRRRTDARS